MNAGIADGVALAWLISSVLNGWDSKQILSAYEAERWPITEPVSRWAIAKVWRTLRPLVAVFLPEPVSCRA